MSESSNVYRLPAPIAKIEHRGPLLDCPACGADLAPLTCPCGSTKVYGEGYICGASGCSTHTKTWKRAFAASPIFCAPGRRVVVSGSWFWKRRCDEPGAHIHQRCISCGWRGILLPATEDA